MAESFLNGAVDISTRFDDCPGCFGVNGALAASDESETIRQCLIDWRAEGERLLVERLKKAQAADDLPLTEDPTALAAYLMAVAHGIAVQAKAGFPREKLFNVSAQALRGWPG